MSDPSPQERVSSGSSAVGASAAPAVRITDLVKTYGSTRALKGVSVTLEAGTVHALVGENGAGKSTALGVLAGRTPPTKGLIEVFGEELRGGDPRASHHAGVAAIYQELTIVPALTAEANIFLGHPLSRRGLLNESAMRKRYVELCERIGLPTLPPRTIARSLSVADQQLLEILRALVLDARIILFDEPTASLAEAEREALYRLIRRLRHDGVTVALVSHNLEEVLDISDTITVFRDGEVVKSGPREGYTKESLVRAMLGEVADLRPDVTEKLLESAEGETRHDRQPSVPVRGLRSSKSGTPVLAASGITVPGSITDLDIEVRAGEIVGVGGLVGSGRTSLLRALAGLAPDASGRMWIDGTEVPWPRTVRRALKYGIALIPEDRKSQGLVMPMSVMENVALSNLGRAARAGIVSSRKLERDTGDVGTDFGLSPSRLRHRASSLSGGNQQKLLLARWKYVRPRILLADEPTRGIDVGAKAEILTSLEAMAAESMALVVVSSELEEVITVADRIYVLSEGLSAGHLENVEGDVTAADILNLAFRVHRENA